MKILIVALILVLVPCLVLAASDKDLLKRDGYLGKFSAGQCRKNSGTATLEVYDAYIKNVTTHGLPNPSGINKLSVSYDEICEQKTSGTRDISTVYLKGGQIQAATVKKLYFSNPLTGEKFKKPQYKTVTIDTRAQIMQYY